MGDFLHWQITIYFFPLLLAAGVALALAVYAWHRRRALAATSFSVTMLAIAFWSFGYALELASDGLTAKIFWTRVEYIGIVVAPVAALALALQFTGRQSWLTRRRWPLLAAVPAISLLLVWTNDAHTLFHRHIYLGTTGSVTVFSATYGPWFWIHAAYSYLVLLLAIALLVDTFLHAPRVYRGQTFALVLGASLPLLANVFYLSGPEQAARLDPTPFAFVLCGLVIAWGLFRFDLFDVVPVARDTVIESMSDGVVVLDLQGRVVDVNPAVEAIAGRTISDIVGQPALQVLPAFSAMQAQFREEGEVRTEVKLGADAEQRIYDLRVSPLSDRRGQPTGRLLVYSDITAWKRAETAARNAEDLFRTIFENAPVGLYRTTPDGRIMMANPAMVKLLGCASCEELVQRNLEGAGFEPDYPRAEFKRRIEREGQIIGLESAWKRHDGEVRYVRENARVVSNGAGDILFYEGTVEDVTERKRAEDELRDRERFLAQLNDITRTAIETTDLTTMLQSLADRLGEVMRADGCYLGLWDEAKRTTMPGAAHGAWCDAYLSVRLDPGEMTITEAVLRTGHPLVIQDMDDSPSVNASIAAPFPNRSMLALPLVSGDQRLGAALIVFEASHQFTSQEIERGEQVARQISLAIARARLLEYMHVQWREAETLREAGTAVTESLSLHDTLERILVQLEHVVPYDSASIQLLRGGHLEIVDGRGFADRETVIGKSFPVPADNPNSEVVTTRKPVNLTDTWKTYPEFRQPPHDHIRAWLGVPLIHHDEIIGVLAVDSSEPGHFDREHVRLVTPFANQAAVAIANARLYEESQRRIHELAGLYDTSLAISGALETDMLLERLHDQVQHLMGPDTVVVVMCDSKTDEFEVTFAKEEGETVPGTVGLRLPLGKGGLTAWVLVNRKSLLVKDLEVDTLPVAPQHGSRPARAWLGVPLMVGGRLLGAISVQSFTPAAFDDADRQLLESLAAQISIALENARLVEALRQRTAELEASNEELDAFAHTVAHDLQNPLGIIIGFADTLREAHATISRESLGNYLQIIARNGRTMSNIIDEILLLAGVRQMEVEMAPIEMERVVSEALQRLTFAIEDHQADVTIPQTWPRAMGHAPWIEEVWVNYISNALKYGGSPPTVELGATVQEDGMIRFWVKDNGRGLALEEQQRLFTPFTRLDRVRTKGHGLGLSIVRRIVERLGGTVDVHSQVGRGSEFTFTLPPAEK